MQSTEARERWDAWGEESNKKTNQSAAMSNKGFWLASRRSQRSCEERSDEALENEERSDEHLNRSNQVHRVAKILRAATQDLVCKIVEPLPPRRETRLIAAVVFNRRSHLVQRPR
jgi:hypothetical protein